MLTNDIYEYLIKYDYSTKFSSILQDKYYNKALFPNTTLKTEFSMPKLLLYIKSFYKNNFDISFLPYDLTNKFKATFIDSLFDAFFNDISIEMLDICLHHKNNDYFEMQTIVQKYNLEISPDTLKKRLFEAYEQKSSNYYWNFLLAESIFKTKKRCSLSLCNGTAIINSLHLIKNHNADINHLPNSFREFYEYMIDACYLMNNKESSSIPDNTRLKRTKHPNKLIVNHDFLKEYYSYPCELTMYRIDRIWKLFFTAKMLLAFLEINTGCYIFSNTTKKIYYKYDLSSRSNNDFEPFFSLCNTVNQHDSLLQTNLFLMHTILTFGIDTRICDFRTVSYELEQLYDELSLIKDSIYYYILYRCINKELTGKQLYEKLFDYCSETGYKAVQKIYSANNVNIFFKSLPNPTPFQLPIDKKTDTNCICSTEHLEYLYSNIRHQIRYDGDISTLPISPETYEYYKSYHNSLNQFQYFPIEFDN